MSIKRYTRDVDLCVVDGLMIKHHNNNNMPRPATFYETELGELRVYLNYTSKRQSGLYERVNAGRHVYVKGRNIDIQDMKQTENTI